MDFVNVYEDNKRAESYARLEFPGTYYLAYRDIPAVIEKHTTGKKALDFGCGTGRSTRFLKNLGFEATGVDISPNMIAKAREFDDSGRYILSKDSEIDIPDNEKFDLILSVFTFDNIPGAGKRRNLLKKLGNHLKSSGVMVLVDSTPEIYFNEWLSFSTKDFPGNRDAKSGGKVRIIMTDVEDRRPVEDTIWFDDDYRELFTAAGMKLTETLKPLGKSTEPYEWVNETQIAPWIIYVLKKN